jgi:putative acetyltransferase
MTATAIVRTDSGNADFRSLVTLLDADLRIRDGEEHGFYATFNKIDSLTQVVVAYRGGIAVGSGAIKRYSDEIVEIKRMYVLPNFRGQGVAGEVLRELEKWAVELGFSQSILETGKKQPEAIRLYQKSGYTQIPNYGQYQGVDNSVCMRKQLPQPGS